MLHVLLPVLFRHNHKAISIANANAQLQHARINDVSCIDYNIWRDVYKDIIGPLQSSACNHHACRKHRLLAVSENSDACYGQKSIRKIWQVLTFKSMQIISSIFKFTMKLSVGIDTTVENNRKYVDNKQDNRHFSDSRQENWRFTDSRQDNRHFIDSRQDHHNVTDSRQDNRNYTVCIAATGQEAEKLLQQSMKMLQDKQYGNELASIGRQSRDTEALDLLLRGS